MNKGLVRIPPTNPNSECRAGRHWWDPDNDHKTCKLCGESYYNPQYYIQHKGYVGNCLIWWRLGSSGYTTEIREAQQYTEEEALMRCKDRPDQDFMWLVEDVEEAATLHVDSQHLDYRKRYGYVEKSKL